MAPSNEALIKSAKLCGPFRIRIAMKTSLVRLLENRFEPLGDFKHMQLYLIAASLTLPAFMQSVIVWINSFTINAYLASGLEACPFPEIP